MRRTYSYSERSARSLYIARTVPRAGNKPTDRMLRLLGREFAGEGSIKALESLHMTLISASFTRPALAQARFSPKDMRDLRGDLVEVLRDAGFGDTLVARIDPVTPIAIYGRHRHLLGLNVVEDDMMYAQHELVMSYAHETLGIRRKPIDNLHITLGAVSSRLLMSMQQEPERILPRQLVIPGTVCLNGLDAFIGRIHPDEA